MIDLSLDLKPSGYGRLRRHLARGGRLVREDIGPPIGVRWCCATRSGDDFDTRHAERFMVRPFTIDGIIYELEEERPNTFYAKETGYRVRGKDGEPTATV